MAVSREKLGAIIAGRARTLCTPESDRVMDTMKTNKPINENYGGNPLKALSESEDYWGTGDSYQNYNHTSVTNSGNDIAYDRETASLSKMPDAIKNSLLEHRIDMTGSISQSVLDTMNIKEPVRKINEIKSQPQVQPQYIPTQSNVDYSIIKAIVNECLNEYFSKNMLNENASLQTIALKEGNISLVDNKGNIFKAKLEKIGNKNDKK